jgi:uncharacterized protein
MKTILCIVAFLLAVITTQGAAPSDKSVLEMMNALHVEQMLNQMLTQLDQGTKAGMEKGFQDSMKGKEITPAQRAALDNCTKKMSEGIKAELSYEKVKDVYLQVYRETFSQEEINSIIAFYSSPAGKAMVEKIPVAMQKSGTVMQARIVPLFERLKTVQKECMDEIAKTKANP